MVAHLQDFDEMKRFVAFGADDAANLKRLAPVFADAGPGITDAFYDVLGTFDETKALVEGRVEALKRTHARWMSELFQGEYGETYFQNRMQIGMVHVKVGLPPWYVEGVMSLIRAKGYEAIAASLGAAEAGPLYESLLKLLDLDLMIINLAYAEERLDRVSAFTGMSRKLIENVINRAKK